MDQAATSANGPRRNEDIALDSIEIYRRLCRSRAHDYALGRLVAPPAQPGDDQVNQLFDLLLQMPTRRSSQVSSAFSPVRRSCPPLPRTV